MKTKKELEEEIEVRCKLDSERRLSNELYAIKLVEKIVFSLCVLIAVGFVGSILRIIWKWNNEYEML